MKQKLKVLISAVVLGAMLNSCFGSFGATRFLYNFNDSFDNKFVKTIIMWCFTILPAYPLFIFADFWIINLIEFWSGSNPISGATYEYSDDGSLLVHLDDGTLRVVPVSENRMLVERDGAVVGEVYMGDDKKVQMTDYATATVRELDVSHLPEM
ncbi:MAG: DUF3332 domain-containing protein [Proteobacteria bacterium]|nr:DUF3332 domain-containing protein [Pseudomonadota bacterium]